MRIGAVFPQTEIGTSAPVIRDYARAVEDMGFTHVLAYDHTLGVTISIRPDWKGPYTSESAFHEVLVLFGYLAAVTERIELVTGVLVLPRRQTALVAKQAAAVDVLSGGRLRLGIGVGWHEAEFEGSGMGFHDRGIRSEEQTQVLRALWRRHAVTFTGRWHSIEAAGVNPLPVRRSIPIWLGSGAEAALRRVARLGDGWMPELYPGDRTRDMLERLRSYTREAWRALGTTHLCVNTMGIGLPSPEAHLATLRRVKAALGDLGD